jgi:hypothetical protein
MRRHLPHQPPGHRRRRRLSPAPAPRGAPREGPPTAPRPPLRPIIGRLGTVAATKGYELRGDAGARAVEGADRMRWLMGAAGAVASSCLRPVRRIIAPRWVATVSKRCRLVRRPGPWGAVRREERHRSLGVWAVARASIRDQQAGRGCARPPATVLAGSGPAHRGRPGPVAVQGRRVWPALSS